MSGDIFRIMKLKTLVKYLLSEMPTLSFLCNVMLKKRFLDLTTEVENIMIFSSLKHSLESP